MISPVPSTALIVSLASPSMDLRSTLPFTKQIADEMLADTPEKKPPPRLSGSWRPAIASISLEYSCLSPRVATTNSSLRAERARVGAHDLQLGAVARLVQAGALLDVDAAAVGGENDGVCVRLRHLPRAV